MRRRIPVVAGIFVLALAVAACSSKPKAPAAPSEAITGASAPVSSGGSASASARASVGASAGSSDSASAPASGAGSTAATTRSPAPAKGAVDPNAPEVVEPGDIPDNQAFVTFHATDGQYTVDVPEGWARTEKNGVVTFTDKYNSIEIRSIPATAAPTPESVKADNLADVTVDPTFKLLQVKPVTRKAGAGVLVTYEIGSSPNKVTGKKALLAVERYVFFHNGNDVLLTLSGAKGADNVDPWKTVSDSLKWL